MKRTPLLRKTWMRRTAKPLQRTAFKPKARTGLRQVSTKRRRELKDYAARRLSFLSLPANQWCPVAAAGVMLFQAKRQRTTDVHHMAGRSGRMLNDECFWLAVSRAGHDWIHANPNEARARGWLK